MIAFIGTSVVIGVVATLVIATLLRGWVFSILWGWFAVPIFGLPPLGIAQAIAVALIVSMLTHQYVPSKEKDTWGPWGAIFLTPLFALGIGWIVKQYI